MTKQRPPRWRHWHVEGRRFGYLRREALKIASDDAAYYGVHISVERCDIDHSEERKS